MRVKAVELTCNSVQDLNYHFAEIEELLALPESEETWDKLTSALTRLKSLSDNGAAEFPSVFVSLIRGVARPLVNCVNSERSKLSGVSLEFFVSLGQTLQSSFAPLVPIFFPTLLSQCMRSNKVFSARGKACVIEIIGSTQLPGILTYLVNSVKDKSIAMRLAAAEAALACLNACDPEELVKGVRQGEIESIIKATIQDPSSDIRKTSRRLFEAYTILNPDRIDTFVQPLSPTAKKYLNVKPKEQLQSSTNPRSQVGPAPSRSTRSVPPSQTAKSISKPALSSLSSNLVRPASALSHHSTHSITSNTLSTTSTRINTMSQARVEITARPGPSRIMNQPSQRSGSVTRVQPGAVPVPGDLPKMGPRRITIVPAPPTQEVPLPKPKLPAQTTSVPERPKSRMAMKVPPTIPSQTRSTVPSRPPSVTESSRKELDNPKAESTRSRSQTRTVKLNQTEKTKEVPLRSRTRTISNARPPSRMDLFKPTARPPSRMDLSKSTRPPSKTDSSRSTRTGVTTATKITDRQKRPEPQLTHTKASKESNETEVAISVPLPPSPTLPPAPIIDSLPSLKLETEVEFVSPTTVSPRKATAETKVVQALKTGLPLLGSSPPSPSPTTEVEVVRTSVPTSELAEPATEPSREEPALIVEPQTQVVEQHVPVPDPALLSKEQPPEPLPLLVHPAPEPPMPPKVKGNEGKNKVGDLVAHFEDNSRRKPPRPPRMIEQTPISALVSTIRKGFEEMRPLPALETVAEGDSVDMTPRPRPISGLKVGGVKGLNIRSKPGLGERAVLTTMQLNN